MAHGHSTPSPNKYMPADLTPSILKARRAEIAVHNEAVEKSKKIKLRAWLKKHGIAGGKLG